MIVRFDSLNRFERPMFHLCNPGTKYENGALTGSIGILSDTSDEELELNFNATSVLSMRVYRRHHDDPEQNAHFLKLFSCLQNKRMIYIEDIGFFIITSVEFGYDKDLTFKDIEAESCEVEFQYKKLPYVEDNTYKFDLLLDTVIGSTPMWTVAHIDDSVNARHRTFEDVDTDQNVLSFLLEDMQDAYECIFIFDTVHRTISVYDQNDYVRQTNIHLTKNDLITSIDVSEDSEDMYTALSVFGSDGDLTIAAVNPLGTSVVYNFDYYLDWMSDELRAKVVQWKALVDYYANADGTTPDADNYMHLGAEYAIAYTDYMDAALEIERVTTQLNLYQRCYDNVSAVNGNSLIPSYNDAIAKAGGTPIDEMITDVDDLQAAITQLIHTAKIVIADQEVVRDSKMARAGEIWQAMLNINAAVRITTYFTEDEYAELSSYISEGTYSDPYIITTDDMTYEEQYEQMRTLYQRATDQIGKISQPTQEFSIDVENFLFQKSFAHFADQLETGCIIDVELDDGDIAPLFLSNLTVNYDDLKLSLTFGNRFCRFDPKAMFNDVLGNVRKSANTIEYMKQLLYPLKAGELSELQTAFNQSRNITKDNALAATGQNIIIDDTGYTGKKELSDGLFDPRQVKIVNNNIVFTKDAWDTCSVAIGEILFKDSSGRTITAWGINAETLIGNLLIGDELQIGYTDESTGTQKNLISVVEGTIESVTAQYYESASATEATGGTWVNDIPDPRTPNTYLWVRDIYTYVGGTSSVGEAVCTEGVPGTSGRGISSVTEYYAKSSSSTTAPSSGWATSVPLLDATEKYLWNYEVIAYTDSTSTSTQPSVVGVYGDDGRGISSITEHYLASPLSSGVTKSTSGWTTTVQTVTTTDKYLWNYETVIYTDSTTSETEPVVIGVYGDTGVGISSVTEYYAKSSDSTTPPASGWATGVPTLDATDKYLWNYEAVTYTDGNTINTPKAVIGVFGIDGQDGVSITSIVEHYLATSASSGIARSTTGWTTTVQTVDAAKKYLWNYETVNYSSGSPTETEPVIIGTYGDKGDKGDKGDDALALAVISSNGTIFKHGSIGSTLSAVLYAGRTDITDNYAASCFIWTRVSDDTAADTVWNNAHASGAKQISITASDVDSRATFFCTFTST